eukprot:maker-scaffold_5-snap-gene-7.7-mRNA-1 protein AED:0.02 eAED:0.02 QI:426/1/1/1/0.33/0.25/4/1077/79
MADNNSTNNNNKFPQIIKKKLLKTKSFIFPPNRTPRGNSELEVEDESKHYSAINPLVSVLTSIQGEEPKNQAYMSRNQE